MTDGQSNVHQSLTIPNAKKLKDMGVKISVVAVGNIISGIDEIAKVASYPPKENVYRVRKLSDFVHVIDLAWEKVKDGYKAKPYTSPCP